MTNCRRVCDPAHPRGECGRCPRELRLSHAVADFTTQEKAMRARTYRMRATHGLLTGLFTAGACLAVTAPPTFAGANQLAPSGQTQTEAGANGSDQPAEKPAAVSSAPGMTVYIDRRTGALLPGPTPTPSLCRLPRRCRTPSAHPIKAWWRSRAPSRAAVSQSTSRGVSRARCSPSRMPTGRSRFSISTRHREPMTRQ